MLRFIKSLPYLPDLARPRPLISEEDKARAAAEPPLPVPFHCKPWLDGQTIGWTLFYGYRTAVTLHSSAGGKVVAENLEQLDGERGQPDTVTLTERGLRLETGYSLGSPAGLVTLLIPANRPVPGLLLEMACLETEQQYQPVSLVFRMPADGEINLMTGAELARAVLIPRPESGQARPLEGEELVIVRQREAAYRAEEQMTPTRWTAATGDSFTHLYRVWSRRETRKA
jgi:hypothetical protein